MSASLKHIAFMYLLKNALNVAIMQPYSTCTGPIHLLLSGGPGPPLLLICQLVLGHRQRRDGAKRGRWSEIGIKEIPDFS